MNLIRNKIKNNIDTNTFFLVFIVFWAFVITAILNFLVIQRIILAVLIVLYSCVLFLFKKSYRSIDLLCMTFIIALFNLGQIVGGRISEQGYIYNFICCAIVIFVSAFFIFTNLNPNTILICFKNNWLIFIVIFFFFSFSIETIDAWAMWDARVYYSFPYGNLDIQGMATTFESNFSTFHNLYLYGHASAGYTLWLMLFQMFRQSYGGVQIADIILASISIYAYYMIVKYFIRDSHKNVLAAIATVPYAFSPFILGMVGNINLDSSTTYFLVIFAACSLYEMKCMEIITATALCFTKETALVYYCMFIMGKILLDFTQKRRWTFKAFLQISIGNIKNYIYSIPVIIWSIMCFLDFNGSYVKQTGLLWNNEGMHCFGVNINVITAKLKQIFLLNFNWIFWITLLLILIGWLKRKNKCHHSETQKIFPFCMVGIAIIIFGILYITCTHARYIIPLIPCLYLCTTVLIMNKKKILCAFSIVMSLILYVQCFWSIDPIMKISFPSMSVGKATIYSMYEHNIMSFCDCIIYNRQYQYWGNTLELVLENAGYDGEMLIVLPDDRNCTRYCLFGDHITLWNTMENQLEYYDENIPLTNSQKEIQVTQLHLIKEINYQYKTALYIIPVWGTIDNDFLSEKQIEREGSVQCKGYIVQWYVLSDYT